jgi:hypothetical protein
MSRKTGLETLVEVEMGGMPVPLSEMMMDENYTGKGARYLTDAPFISPLREPEVYLDGVISGLRIKPGLNPNEVIVEPGEARVGGQVLVIENEVTVTAVARPSTPGNVMVTAITIDPTGAMVKTAADEGAVSRDRGVAGGLPFLPVEDILLGYVPATYASASDGAVFSSSEIDSDSKERTSIPGVSIAYRDGGEMGSNKGAFMLSNALPLIHAADPMASEGTHRRRLFASYTEPDFEELPDSYDFSVDRDVATSESQAYGEDYPQKALGAKSWSSSGSVYWTKAGDFSDQIDATKRWVKIYPDRNDPKRYYAGIAVVKVSKSMPKADNMTATITLDGAGELFTIS